MGCLSESERFGAEGFAVVFLDFVEIAHAWAGKADELPANHAGIASVERIAKHSFDGVLAEESEEQGGFDFVKGSVLFGGREEVEAGERFQTFAIDSAGSLFALIAEVGGGVFERRLSVAIAIAAVGAGELAVDVDGDASFAGAGAGFVRRENTGRGCSDDQSFFFGEETEWNANGFVLSGEERCFAI